MDYLWRSLGYTTTSSNGAGAATEPTDIPAAATEVAATERPDWTKMMTGGCPVHYFFSFSLFFFSSS